MIITASFTLWILNCWWCYCCLGYCCHTICPPFCRLFLVHFGQRSHSYYAKEWKFLVGNYSKEWWGGRVENASHRWQTHFQTVVVCLCFFFVSLFSCFHLICLQLFSTKNIARNVCNCGSLVCYGLHAFCHSWS